MSAVSTQSYLQNFTDYFFEPCAYYQEMALKVRVVSDIFISFNPILSQIGSLGLPLTERKLPIYFLSKNMAVGFGLGFIASYIESTALSYCSESIEKKANEKDLIEHRFDQMMSTAFDISPIVTPIVNGIKKATFGKKNQEEGMPGIGSFTLSTFLHKYLETPLKKKFFISTNSVVFVKSLYFNYFDYNKKVDPYKYPCLNQMLLNNSSLSNALATDCRVRKLIANRCFHKSDKNTFHFLLDRKNFPGECDRPLTARQTVTHILSDTWKLLKKPFS